MTRNYYTPSNYMYQLTKSTFKGANDYDKHKNYYNKEKEK